MNKKAILIFISVIVILIIVAVIIGVIIINTEKEEKKENNNYNVEDEIEATVGVYSLDNYNYYFTILDIITDYYRNVAEQNSEGIYNILDNEYIKNNGINENNVLSKLEDNFNKNCTYKMKKIYTQETNDKIVFITFGNIVNGYYGSSENCYNIVFVDKTNSTYSIYPINKNEYDTYVINGISNKTERIAVNEYNKFNITLVKEQTIIQTIFDDMKENLISDSNYIYGLLDEEYRIKRFGSVENFKKYIQKNQDYFSKIRAESYLVNTYSDYTEYVVKDQYDNYYIFDEKAVLDYTVKLDTYTLDNDKFNKTYSTATNKDKVLMNLDKFFQMLNANDYRSSYAVLDDNFKATYFQTEESFENFVKQYMYPHANTKFMNFSDKISGVFTYYVELTNKANENDKEIGMNVVMQLKEGTDFRISFEIVR